MANLFLIPTTLSNNINHNVLPPQQLDRIKHLQYFIVETAKVARMHIKQLNLATPLQELNIQELNKHKQDLDNLIKPLLLGFDVGLISDCGLPAIADPGNTIVHHAHNHGVKVIPLAGSSSLLLALMSSGVNGQAFAFQGYLPIDVNARRVRLKEMEQLILQTRQSQIIIEAPFRNQQLFQFFIDNLSPNITLSLAINLMNLDEVILSKSIKNWRLEQAFPDLHKQEVVFVIGML